MEKYLINGGKTLEGVVEISSSKNAVLPMMAASIMTNEQVIIEKCPLIKDVFSMIDILSSIGAKTEFVGESLIIDPKNVFDFEIKSEYSKELRSSVFMLGALLSKFKKAKVFLPGGCKIGERPVDIHIDCLSQLGYDIKCDSEKIYCEKSSPKCKEIRLSFPSVGATENLIMASVFIKGTTVLKNCAQEPEVADLCRFLNKMGAKISGIGCKELLITGVKTLHGVSYLPIKDRIEGGTFLSLGAMLCRKLEIRGFEKQNILLPLHNFYDNTCKMIYKDDIIYMKNGVSRNSFSFITGPYPMFPTDLQAPTMAYLVTAKGESVVRENVFENRFHHVEEYKKMGANVTVKGRACLIRGVKELKPARLVVKDLRGGAGITMCALFANGLSEIEDIRYIERGYPNFVEKLSALGADIKKVQT